MPNSNSLPPGGGGLGWGGHFGARGILARLSRWAAPGYLAYLVCFALTAHAGEADVVAVEAVKDGAGVYRFNVTVAHGDTGWDHYADKWDVVAPDGTVLGTRVLLHPHENEQPFTRSLGGVAIPAGVTRVTLRAHDSVHGYGGREASVDLKP